MAINSGQLLKAVGESPYSAYRCFLSANRRLNTTDKVLNELKEAILEKVELLNLEDITVHKPIFYLNHYKQLNAESNRNEIASTHKYYRPKRQCPKCAEIGFHTNLFDETWLDKCPVHETELIDHCNICKNHWPLLDEIISRNCYSCGTALNYSIINENKAQLTNGFNDICFMSHLMQRAKNHLQKYEFYTETQEFLPKPIINNNHLFNISVMAKNGDIFISEKNKAISLGLPFFSFKRRKYEFKCVDSAKRHCQPEDYWEKLNKKISLINEELYSKITDTLNNAKVQSTIYIDLLNVINLFHNKEIKASKKSLSLFKSMISNGLMMPSRHQFMINNGSASNKENMIFYKLPLELTLLIYKIDLWTTYINIFNFICTKTAGINSLFFNRCPFVIQMYRDTLEVYYPSDIFEFDNQKSNNIQRIMELGGETSNAYF